jgi:RNA polymerase sigma-70 factor (ECF subfamily)
MTSFVRHLRMVTLRHDGTDLSDGQLLGLYVDRRDEAALEAIVRRHGAMVMGVCGRVLANRQDVEDAFQATFLVLIRKATAVAAPELLANWLYGVAYNTALKARAAAARRRVREKQVSELPEGETRRPEEGWRDLLPLLDQELNRLPEKYRVPIVLCELEGKAHKEVAQRLGWPIGTVSGRLARGRKMLARRLARHGVSLSTVSLAALLSYVSASAAVPAALVPATIRAGTLVAVGKTLSGIISTRVAALTEGVLRAMLLTKLKIAVPVLLVASVMAAGMGVAPYCAETQQLALAAEPQNEAGGPAAAGQNLLQNAGFEEGDGAPAHWSQGAQIDGVEYLWDKRAGYKSKSSLCLHKTANRYFPVAQWYQVVQRQGSSSELRVGAQVKAEKVTKAILDVIFLDEGGEWIAHEWAAYIGAKEAGSPPADHDWKEYSGRVKIPQGTKKIQVCLQIYGPGKVWFDDVRAEYAK